MTPSVCHAPGQASGEGPTTEPRLITKVVPSLTRGRKRDHAFGAYRDDFIVGALGKGTVRAWTVRRRIYILV